MPAGGVPCTTVVQMPKHNPSEIAPSSVQVGTRLSVTLPADHYRQMQQVAEQKKVSIAWVIRDAVDRYLATHGAPGPGPGSARSAGRTAAKRGAA